MQFQVPQFIDTEDKIVGPLTLRQFIFICSATGLSTILYFTVQPWLWIVLSLPILALGLSLAFIKINSLPFYKVLFSAAEYYWHPQTYVWLPENPAVLKNENTLRELFSGEMLENILAGKALKDVRQDVETRTKNNTEGKSILNEIKSRYEIITKGTGEQQAARRVDYR